MNISELKNQLLQIDSIEERTEAINEIKAMLKEVSPFKTEPVECVQWVKSELVFANDYNPNSVAPPRNGITPHINTRGRIYTADSRMAT